MSTWASSRLSNLPAVEQLVSQLAVERLDPGVLPRLGREFALPLLIGAGSFEGGGGTLHTSQ
jgi:hypothetical protein